MMPLLGQTRTFDLPPAGCVKINNCTIYGPAESYSLWEELGAAGQSWQIFNVYSWSGGFSVVDTYHCDSAVYKQSPAGAEAQKGSTTEVAASCSSVDSDGRAFTMNYVVHAYSYYSRGCVVKAEEAPGRAGGSPRGSVTIAQ
jgi:hypothetical protein